MRSRAAKVRTGEQRAGEIGAANVGAAEIGAVLAAIDQPNESWWPAPKFWIASAGVTALSFIAGFILVRAMTVSSPDLPLAIVGVAMGQADIGGLL